MSDTDSNRSGKHASNSIVSLPDREAIDLAAAEWLMRFEGGEITAADLQAFHAWRMESDHHREAFEAAARLWGALDRLEELNDYAAAEKATRNASHRSADRPHRRAAIAAAASLVLIAGAGALLYGTAYTERDHVARHSTIVGEQKTVSLPDGSVIELNTNSRVEVTLGRDARRIRLLSGEAYFNVAHDPARPFSVHARNHVVTAVGTTFTVRLRERLVDVVVAEGRVKLARDEDEVLSPDSAERPRQAPFHGPPLELTAGQTAQLDKQIERLDFINPETLNRRLSWRNGMLAFAGEPLSDVVADIARYTNITIEIEDAALRVLPVSGYFKAGEVEAMLDALELMGGVEVERVNAGLVRLKQVSEG